MNAELKKADPNHLYLGCRFAGFSPEILGPAATYTDVLSFNVYRYTLDAGGWDVLDAYDKPFVVGEFHFGSADRGTFDSGLVGVADQEGRAFFQPILDFAHLFLNRRAIQHGCPAKNRVRDRTGLHTSSRGSPWRRGSIPDRGCR